MSNAKRTPDEPGRGSVATGQHPVEPKGGNGSATGPGTAAREGNGTTAGQPTTPQRSGADGPVELGPAEPGGDGVTGADIAAVGRSDPAGSANAPETARDGRPGDGEAATPPPDEAATAVMRVPSAAEQARPAAAEQARPPAAEQARPSAAEKARPPAAEQARPPAAEQVRPAAAEQARPSAAEQARPGGTTSAPAGGQPVRPADPPGSSGPASPDRAAAEANTVQVKTGNATPAVGTPAVRPASASSGRPASPTVDPVPAPAVPPPGPAAAQPPPWRRMPGPETARPERVAPSSSADALLDDGPTAFLEAPRYGAPASSSPTTDAPTDTGSWARVGRSRPPRQAALQLKRLDPWSVLKLALVLAVVLFFIWLVAVGVLYGVLDGMGVWDRLNGTYADLVSGESQTGNTLISAGRVFGLAAVVGAINSLLFAVAVTVGAFVYNVSADLVGGIEVTLSERD